MTLLLLLGAIPSWIFWVADILLAVLVASNIALLLALRRNK